MSDWKELSGIPTLSNLRTFLDIEDYEMTQDEFNDTIDKILYLHNIKTKIQIEAIENQIKKYRK